MKDGDSPQALRALCRLAGEQAAGWQPGAHAAGAGVPRSRRRLLKIGVVGGLGLLALAVVAAQFGGERTSRTSAPAPAAAPAPTPRQALPWSAPTPAAAAPAEPVRRQGSEPAAPAAAAAPAAEPARPPQTDSEREEAESQPGGSC